MSEAETLKGLVLAGGTGSRLRPLTYAMPKQLVPVANRPILWFALDSIVSAGVSDIGIIISPETGDAIKQSLYAWLETQDDEVALTFISQEMPAGLAHAVKISEPYLQQSPFLMYLGDNLIDADLKPWCADFLSQANISASILLKPVDNPSSFGVAVLDDDGHVTRLVEKPKEPPSNLALVGVYLFRPEIFTSIHAIQPSPRGELEITDAIQHLITSGSTVRSQQQTSWWLDTGKKDDLLSANQTVLASLAQRFATIQPELDASNYINGFVQLGENASLTNCTITGPVAIGDGCHLSNVTLGPNVSLGADSTVTDCTLRDSVVLDGCALKGVQLVDSLLGYRCTLTGPANTLPPVSVSLAEQSVLHWQ
jgi:glucose-1-phosphate thymidylyltransferase